MTESCVFGLTPHVELQGHPIRCGGGAAASVAPLSDPTHVRPLARLFVGDFIEQLGESSPGDSLDLSPVAAAPVNAATTYLQLAELLSFGEQVEFQTTARFRELRHVEIHVHRMLTYTTTLRHTSFPH